MRIPEKRTPQLVEIQLTVLPEAEWLMGLTDLTYFQGIGFSLPIPFDVEYLGRSDDHEDVLVQAMMESSEYASLYAFLPGLFYCSIQNTSVDAILVEVIQKEMLGMTLGSFRPESVRTFDIRNGLAVDESGKIHGIEMSMETIGKFATGISTEIANALDPGFDKAKTQLLKEVAYSREIEIAGCLAEMLPLSDLKRAYLSGAILTGQLMMLLQDIETHGFRPRYRIYVKNHKHPEGKVVEVRYRGLEGVSGTHSRLGIDCPQEVDLGMELMRLSFARLIGDGKEVNIEEAILDTLELFHTKLSASPTKNQVIDLIFEEVKE